MFPLVDGSNQIRPILHILCEQAISAGVESIGIVVSPCQTEMVRQYFAAANECGFAKLSAHVEYITQESARGFGDAVLQGRGFIGEEPFVVLLGDHIYFADEGKSSCILQAITAFNTYDAVAMIGMRLVTAGELSKVGVASGVQIEQDVYRCTGFIEKPDLAAARRKLVTEGLGEDEFLAHSGIYILSPDIFGCLSQVSETVGQKGGEVELADAQSLLLRKHPEQYLLYRIAGRTYDVGTPAGYADAQTAFRDKKSAV
jgi:UTP--glucose-1-phosphate uridylyltransferase